MTELKLVETDAKTPAWQKRDPLSQTGTASRLNAMAEARMAAAREIADRDIAAGLNHGAGVIARAAKAIVAGQTDADLADAMRFYGEAKLGCARATTEPRNRAAYMDDAHAFREAVRYLGGAQ